MNYRLVRPIIAATLLAAIYSPVIAEPDEGSRLFNKGDYSAAAMALDIERAREPDNLGIVLSLAVTRLQMKDYVLADRHIAEAITLAPDATFLRQFREATRRDVIRSVGSYSSGKDILDKLAPLPDGGSPTGPDNSAELLKSLAEKSPLSAPLANLAGDNYLLSQNPASAEEWYKRAMGLAPTWTKPLLGLALTVIDKDPARSVNLLERVTKVEMDNGQALLWLGDAYGRVGQTELAREAYEKSSRIHTSAADAFVRLGTSYLKSFETDKAEAAFRQAVTVDPENKAAALGLAETQSLNKNYQQALQSMQGVLTTATTESRAVQAALYASAGAIEAAAGNLKSAVDLLNAAIQMEPTQQSSYKDLVSVYTQSGTLSEKMQEAKVQNAASPSDSILLRFLLEAHSAKEERGEEIIYLDKLIKAEPQFSWQWLMRKGNVQLAMGQEAEAVSTWALACESAYPSRTTRVAKNIVQLNVADRALELLASEKYNEPTIKLAALHLKYALASNQEKIELALTYLSELIKLDSQNATLFGQRAMLFRKLGQNAEAEADFAEQRRLMMTPPPPTETAQN